MYAEDEAFREAFENYTSGEDKFTRRMAINMADYFGLPPMFLVWRLEKTGLLKKGAWYWFKANGGITADHIKEARASRAADEAAFPTPDAGAGS